MIVTFVKPFYDHDFVEAGMKAYLASATKQGEGVTLLFDFGDFLEYNTPLFKKKYELPISETKRYTALEAKTYGRHYSVFVETPTKMEDQTNLESLVESLSDYLHAENIGSDI